MGTSKVSYLRIHYNLKNRKFKLLIPSANTKSRPVGSMFSHMLSVRPSALFKSRKTKQQKTMFATGVTMGLAEWIIDDTCIATSMFAQKV